jgi:succinate dehydrogenase / fumarate reductase cytochrome b subunit
MTVAQVIFALALIAVLLGVGAFGGFVLLAAARRGGGAYLTADFARRLRRSPAERAEFNRWSFYAHRFTGFAVFAFLCLHVIDVSLYSLSRDLYRQVHELYGSAPLRLFECGLLLAILFHTFNGLRLMVVDLADLDLTASRRALGGVVILTVALGLAGSAVILKPVFS